MLLLRPDSMTLAGLPGRIGFPGYSLTLVAKATLRLVPGGTCTLLEESLPLTGDEPPFDPDGPSPSLPLTYASDLPIAKPMADVLVVGNAHAPGGKPTQQMTASVRVGALTRRITITGDRFWKQGLLSSSLSTAAPFQSMPLAPTHAFGGAGSKANPAGKGAAVVELADGFKARPAPNLELDGEVMDSPRAKPAPALLGPIPTDWPARASLMKGFKGDYLKTRWPALPADFDFAYFQAADPAQRVAGYLRGDEEIELLGMHPEHATISTRLPGFRVRAIVRDRSKPPAERDREVEMKLDTLWLHGEELLATVVWRGVTPVLDEYFDELESAFAVFERLNGTPMRLSVLLDQTMRERLEGEPEDEQDGEPEGEEAGEPASPPAAEAADEEDEFPGMPEIPPPPPPPTEPPKLSAEDKAKLAAALAAHGVDPSILDDEPEDEADDEPAEPPGWTRERVIEAAAVPGLLAGAELDGLDLGGLDLSGVVLDGASLIGTRLSGAKLAGAMLNGALLERAILDEADLTGASLVEADLSDASLVAVRAGRVNLEGATLDRANLEAALLEGCKAKGASFEHARLTRAVLSKADLSEASLEHANLDEALLREAKLEAASLQEASARKARFDRSGMAKLKAEGLSAGGASFVAAAMDGAWFEGAKLASADFRYAQLADGGFARCDLDDADLSFAVLRRVFFLKASLRRARLVKADLFEAILEKADLREADLSGASVYCAELLDAKLAGARLGGTDLGRTKAEGLAQ